MGFPCLLITSLGKFGNLVDTVTFLGYNILKSVSDKYGFSMFADNISWKGVHRCPVVSAKFANLVETVICLAHDILKSVFDKYELLMLYDNISWKEEYNYDLLKKTSDSQVSASFGNLVVTVTFLGYNILGVSLIYMGFPCFLITSLGKLHLDSTSQNLCPSFT
ncbi:hypothetical protein CR513_44682, partial [Mucuna pruriens]